MAMYIAVELYLSAIQSLFNHVFHSPYFGHYLGTGVYILAIQVKPWEATSVVSHYNTVWIEHRHYLKYVHIPELFGNLVITTDEL
jgi:hypothetical protein